MCVMFFFNDTATTEIYTLSLHDALPISSGSSGRIGTISAGGAEYLATHINQLRAANPNTVVVSAGDLIGASPLDRKSTRLNSSHANISYAVFCLKKKTHRHALTSLQQSV